MPVKPPPIYRPGNTALQGKLQAPPVYRPESAAPRKAKLSQAQVWKSIQTMQARLTGPPVYQPNNSLPVLPKLTTVPRRAPAIWQPSQSAVQPMFDATSLNAQRGNVQNERKSRQVESAIRLGETFFISEIQSSYDPPEGATLISASGRQVPKGGLNYIVPDDSELYRPTLPADVTGALQSVGRPSSYEGLWKHHVRYPVDLGNVNGVQVYGVHAKSRPSLDQQYALAGMILDFVDNVGGDWALIGDLNLPPTTLSQRINELRAGAAAALHFVSLGRSTHSAGLELDYVVTNKANTDIQQISRMNLRKGSDHSGIGVTFG